MGAVMGNNPDTCRLGVPTPRAGTPRLTRLATSSPRLYGEGTRFIDAKGSNLISKHAKTRNYHICMNLTRLILITIRDLVLLTFLMQRQFIKSVGSPRLLDGHPISSASGFDPLVILMLSKTGAATTWALLVSPQAKRGSLAPSEGPHSLDIRIDLRISAIAYNTRD